MQAYDVESFRVNGVTIQYSKWANVNGTGKLPFEIETRGMGGAIEVEGSKRLFIMHYPHVVFLKPPLHNSWLGP
jgi:hypothetical protein